MRKTTATLGHSTWKSVLFRPRFTRMALMAITGTVSFAISSAVTAQETPAEDTRAKVLEQARKALVRVELHLKAVPDEEGPGGMGETTSSQALDQQQRQVIRFKKPIQMMGVVVAPREVLVPDTGVNPQRIDHWEVTDLKGERTVAHSAALLRDAPTLVLAPVDPNFLWKPAEFADAPVNPAAALTLVTPDWAPLDLRWLLKLDSLTAMTRWDVSDPVDAAPFWIV